MRTVRYCLVLMALVVVILSPLVSANALAQGLSEPCSLDSSEPCEPPSLREVEYLVVRVIYAAWAFGGVVFMVLLVIIGGIYLGSAGDQAKVESAKKRGGQWVIGVLLYFLSQPIVATLMRGLVSADVDCYAKLRDPGFTFFFATVCELPDSVTSTPSVTVTGGATGTATATPTQAITATAFPTTATARQCNTAPPVPQSEYYRECWVSCILNPGEPSVTISYTDILRAEYELRCDCSDVPANADPDIEFSQIPADVCRTYECTANCTP